MKKSQSFTIFCIFLTIFMVVNISCGFAIELTEVALIINEAELKLKSAFVAVSKADDVGANIAGLVAELEVAGLFLTEAKLALRVDDYDAANSHAIECINTAEKLIIDADQLKVDAERKQNDIILFTVIGSIGGIVLLIILGITFWRVLKKRYFRKVLDMKPNVEED